MVERVKGQRIYRDYKPDWHFYIDDANGSHKTIYGTKVKQIRPGSIAERHTMMKQYDKKWESDINAVFRTLEQEYGSNTTPDLHVAFFDIETDFDRKRGYSSPQEAFTEITSIAVYMQWIEAMVCFAVPPKTLTWEEAQAIAKEVGDEVILFKTESEMLKAFLDIIEDADVLSGWNSEMYDIPFVINRIIKTLGKVETRKMCLWGEAPKMRMVERNGKESQTYDLIGRISIDYMMIYKKYSYEERHSYALNAIAEAELGQQKVAYDGTLDQLYNHDFKKFLEYNIQDTALLDQLDKKLKYIDLCNTLAHDNCVLIPTTMGTVATIDQAVLIEAHSHNLVVPDKKRGFGQSEHLRAAGGWVATPKKGLHKWIGSSDLNSLYPSVIRALNMSPETIVAQIDLSMTNDTVAEFVAAKPSNSFSGWWNDRFNPLEMENYFEDDNANKMTLKFENGTDYEVTGAELRKIIFESGEPWQISANGTVFRTDIEGIIPRLLSRWYSERKILQGNVWNYNTLSDNAKIRGVQVPADLFTNDLIDKNVHHAIATDEGQVYKADRLEKLVEEGHTKRVTEYMNQHSLMVKDGKAIHTDQAELKGIISFWDKRQLVKKILLNSAYGALLNEGSRFFDHRIGQSTTLTGRTITRHMAAKTNEFITGVYDEYGDAIIYGDTDSSYFSAYPSLKDDIESGNIPWTKESIAEIYDSISDEVSNTFPVFLLDKFNIPIDRTDGVIKSGREIVAETGLFIKKKRYAALVYDDEGTRRDVGGSIGKVKAMGLDLRRSDTPKFIQDFLMELLVDTLTEKGEDHIVEKVKEFKIKFVDMPPWKKGSPKGVNNLTLYKQRVEDANAARTAGKRVMLAVPGHVRASLNWNMMLDVMKDNETTRIVDGQKISICKLKENPTLMKSIAYPTDIIHLPDWFLELPFDEDLMLETLVNKKVSNLLSVLKWDFSKTDPADALFDDLFG